MEKKYRIACCGRKKERTYVPSRQKNNNSLMKLKLLLAYVNAPFDKAIEFSSNWIKDAYFLLNLKTPKL